MPKNTLPLLRIPLINYLTLEKAEVIRFQAKRFIFTVQVTDISHKIFQVLFGKSDGSLYITFPYFDIKEGIVGMSSLSPFVMTSQIDLASGGMVTSEPVKYSHRPDGDAHFSQTGKVWTRIRKKSVPLAQAEGHIFTIQIQGLEHFEEADPVKDSQPPTHERTVLNFDYRSSIVKPQAFKLTGRWYKAKSVMGKWMHPHGFSFGAQVTGVTPNGKAINGFLIGTPKDCPLERNVLFIACEEQDAVDRNKEASFNFIGGFDPPSKFNDLSQRPTFLYAQYPVSNFDELRQQIGTIDIQ